MWNLLRNMIYSNMRFIDIFKTLGKGNRLLNASSINYYLFSNTVMKWTKQVSLSYYFQWLQTFLHSHDGRCMCIYMIWLCFCLQSACWSFHLPGHFAPAARNLPLMTSQFLHFYPSMWILPTLGTCFSHGTAERAFHLPLRMLGRQILLDSFFPLGERADNNPDNKQSVTQIKTVCICNSFFIVHIFIS